MTWRQEYEAIQQRLRHPDPERRRILDEMVRDAEEHNLYELLAEPKDSWLRLAEFDNEGER